MSQDKATNTIELDISHLFFQVWHHKWRVLIIMSLALTLSVVYVALKQPRYQSELLLQIKSNRPGEKGLVGRLSEQFSGASGTHSESTQIALMKSRFILSPVIENLNLTLKAKPQQSFLAGFISPSKASIRIKKFSVAPNKINKEFTLLNDKKNHFKIYSPNQQVVLQGSIGKLATSPDKTLQIWVDAIDAKKNTLFTLKKMPENKILDHLKRTLTINDLGSNKQTTGILSLTLESTDPTLSSRILNKIGRTIQTKDIEKNAIEASKTLAFLYQQLPITKRDLQRSETALNHYRAKSGKIDIKLQGQYLLTQLSDLDKQVGELRINHIDMLQRYTKAHPFSQSLTTKIRELESLRQRLEQQLKELPASDQVAVNLIREVKVKNTLYLLLLNKIQEMQVMKAGIVSDIRILSKAKTSSEPLPTKPFIVYFASLILGFIVSLIFIFSRKILRPKIDDPHWSERQFDIMNVAIIPFSKEQSSTKNHFKGAGQLLLLAQDFPRNLAIESLRSLRTSLQIRLGCVTKNNLVAILGVAPSVGKSFVSANLAYLLAAAGKRVALLDIDLRRGTLHHYFNAPPTPGLANVLLKELRVEEALIKTPHPNLMLLPRGTYPQDPSELLMSDTFKTLLAQIGAQFDIVIVDTSPVLLVTDAVLVGACAGTNYLVMGANTHHPFELELTMKRLNNAGVTIHGTIFNCHNKESGSQNYHHGAYYYEDKPTSEHK